MIYKEEMEINNKTNFIKEIDRALEVGCKNSTYLPKHIKNIDIVFDLKEINNYVPKFKEFKFEMSIKETITVPETSGFSHYNEIVKNLKAAIVKEVYSEIDSKLIELGWNLSRLLGKYDDDKEFREMYNVVEELREMIKP